MSPLQRKLRPDDEDADDQNAFVEGDDDPTELGADLDEQEQEEGDEYEDEDEEEDAPPLGEEQGSGTVGIDVEEFEPMDDDAVEAALGQIIEDAITYVDTELSPARVKATDYYRGRPFGNEVEGRSQVIITDVRDTINSLLPDLMRIFTGPEQVVVFQPKGAEDSEAAELMTAYVNQVLMQDNPGFLILYNALLDGLARKVGVVTWRWSDAELVEHYLLEGVTEEQLTLLATDPEVKAQPVDRTPIPGTGGVDPQTGQPLPEQYLYTVRVQRTEREGRAEVMGVPPEEFIFDRNAISVEQALFVGRRVDMRRGDILAAQLCESEDLEDIGLADSTSLQMNEERIARQPTGSVTVAFGPDPSTKLVEVVFGYVYLDKDGDGIPEHYSTVSIGNARKLVRCVPSAPADRPFALFCPIPEPHTLIGQSTADETMDLQEMKSMVMRNVLDSLAFSIHPRTAVLEGQVRMEDVLNTEVGGIVRERVPNAVRPLDHPFVGAQAFPVMQYLDDVKQDRTGVSKAAAGLNPDALQSSTRAAVAATVSGAQRHVELLARVFAETGMVQLMRGLLRLLVTHQDRPRQVRLFNRFVMVDPRPWDVDMDVSINVATGMGNIEEKMQQLAAIAAKQELVMQTVGPQNPVVSLPQYSHTLAKMVELAGWKDTARFVTTLPPDWQPPPPPPPKPTPEEIYAQVEQMKAQAEIAKGAAQLQLEREKMYLTDDRERDKNEMQAFLQAAELAAKYNLQADSLDAKLRTIATKQREDRARPTPMGGM